jgi:hypothetical protein
MASWLTPESAGSLLHLSRVSPRDLHVLLSLAAGVTGLLSRDAWDAVFARLQLEGEEQAVASVSHLDEEDSGGGDRYSSGAVRSATTRHRARFVRQVRLTGKALCYTYMWFVHCYDALLQVLFDAFDSDADGFVDARELTMGLLALCELLSAGADDKAGTVREAFVALGVSSESESSTLRLSDAEAFMAAEELVRLCLTGVEWPSALASGSSTSPDISIHGLLVVFRRAALVHSSALLAELRSLRGSSDSDSVPLDAFVSWFPAAAERARKVYRAGVSQLTSSEIRDALHFSAFPPDDAMDIFFEHCDTTARVAHGICALSGTNNDAATAPALSRDAFLRACGLISALGSTVNGGNDGAAEAAAQAAGSRLFSVLDPTGVGKVSMGEVVAGMFWAQAFKGCGLAVSCLSCGCMCAL